MLTPGCDTTINVSVLHFSSSGRIFSRTVAAWTMLSRPEGSLDDEHCQSSVWLPHDFAPYFDVDMRKSGEVSLKALALAAARAARPKLEGRIFVEMAA